MARLVVWTRTEDSTASIIKRLEWQLLAGMLIVWWVAGPQEPGACERHQGRGQGVCCHPGSSRAGKAVPPPLVSPPVFEVIKNDIASATRACVPVTPSQIQDHDASPSIMHDVSSMILKLNGGTRVPSPCHSRVFVMNTDLCVPAGAPCSQRSTSLSWCWHSQPQLSSSGLG